MKKIIFPLLFLFLVSIPGMSQFATSKYQTSRSDVLYAKQTVDLKSPQIALSPGTFKVGAFMGFILSRFREKGYEYSKDRASVMFGALAMYQYTERIGFISGILFALNGTRFDYDGADNFGYNLTTLIIPLLVSYAIMPELTIFAGFQLGFILSAKDTEGDDLNDYLKGLDFGFKFGGAYQITEDIFVQIAYTLGLSDIAEEYEGNAIKTGLFEAGVGYYFLRR